MNKLLSALKKKLSVSPPPNQFLELVLSLLEKQDLSTLKRVDANVYSFGDAQVSITYFDPECFEEMQVSLGYELGKGFTAVLRNYGEHLIVINHDILNQFHTVEFPVTPDTILLKVYRERLDAIAERIIASVEALPHD